MFPLPHNIITASSSSISAILSSTNHIFTFLNPVSYLDALDNKDLFSKFDGIFADGSVLVAAIRMLYGKKIERRSFDMTSVAPQLFDYAVQNNKSVYIVASKQEQVEKAVAIFKEKWTGLNIIGFRNGYFASQEEQEQEAMHIAEVNPDFLIVGMGRSCKRDFLYGLRRKDSKALDSHAADLYIKLPKAIWIIILHGLISGI